MAPTPQQREVIAVLVRAGWDVDDVQPHAVEASDGVRYGVAVLFEAGRPVSVEYGDGERDLQHSECWGEAPGVLSPDEVSRLFHDGPPAWPRISPEEAAERLGADAEEVRRQVEDYGPAEIEIGGETHTVWTDESEEE